MQKKTPGRKSKRPTKEQFEAVYSVQSAEEAAKFFKVAKQTIYQWAVEFRKEEEGEQ